MRIFDPKNQFGSSLLSSADTQKSSVKLEKQMAVGGGAITLTSEDISDIENWELSNASVEVDGRMISFLPDTVRNSDGSLTVDFGMENGKAVLVLKRAEFGGVITIEIKIQQLMTKTLIDSKKPDYDVESNVAKWEALGLEAKASGKPEYENASLKTLPATIRVSSSTFNDCFISVDAIPSSGLIFVSTSGSRINFIWTADLPSLVYGSRLTTKPPQTAQMIGWTGKMPNLRNGDSMFQSIPTLAAFISEMPCLTSAQRMFAGCKLRTFQCDMSSKLTTNAAYMFSGCKFDLTSVERISRTIAVCAGEDESAKTIHLGVSSELEGDETLNGYIEAMSKSVEEGGKGWVVVVGYNK